MILNTDCADAHRKGNVRLHCVFNENELHTHTLQLQCAALFVRLRFTLRGHKIEEACFAKNNIPNPVATFAGVGLRTNIFGSVCMGLLLGPAISLVGKFMKKIIPVFREN